MIRSTKNYYLNLNPGKRSQIYDFLSAYQSALNSCINFIWHNSFYDQNNTLCWNIQQDILDLPKFLDYNTVDWNNSQLSARCKSSILTQAIGIVKGSVGKRKHLLYIINKRTSENLSVDKFKKSLDKASISKPIIRNCLAELSSKNIDIQKSAGFFEYWIRIRSTNLPEIKVPIKLSKMDRKWINKNGNMLAGISIGNNYLQLRYDIPEKKRSEGITLGCDTGIKTPVSLSNQTKPLSSVDNHGHTLENIQKKLSRKRKGSNSFRKAQVHRTNYVNWFVNQLNLDGVQKVNLENVSFIGEKVSRYSSHWVHGEIKGKILSRCEELGVQVSLHNSGYYSQRCSKCGLVLKSNRKGKEYSCKGCGNKIDSDLNSAINHERELPEIPFGIRQRGMNKEGFYWVEIGVCLYEAGQEYRVPDTSLLKRIEL